MKILVLTSVYPQPEDDERDGVTPVVHYFSKEWTKEGHEVFVIHNSNKFFLIAYLIPSILKKKINSLLGIVIPKFKQRKRLFRISENIRIQRIPILKVMPRANFLNIQLSKQFKKIKRVLQENNFVPDVITGHWENPQIQLVSMLKDEYNCKSAIILHGTEYINRKNFVIKNKRYIENIDIFGARSKNISIQAKELLQLSYSPFICYSGIPDEFLRNRMLNNTTTKFEDGNLKKFLYVGRLINRKNVDTIIKSLSKLYEKEDFNFAIIGTGYCAESLKKLTQSLSLENKVNFIERVPRETVIDYMKKSQCFTMVSHNEVFGLVYLEAMASGCIVVASRDEGFDGIIVDGLNGFLCKEGDVEELTRVYTKINSLSKSEKRKISENAIETARSFSDSEVAKKYLGEITSTK